MSLRDRGTKKWVSMMLPEHVRELKKSLIDQTKIMQPILDEQKIEVLEELVLTAIETDETLLFSTYEDGFIRTIQGNVHFIDHIKKDFQVRDESNCIHSIPFTSIVNIEKSESH